MNCVNHAELQAAAYCIRCGNALCTECTRNVRGSVYCESCLADVVQGKASRTETGSSSTGTDSGHKEVVAANPGIAFALGLIPGVGAIYNGEFLRAAIHVLIFGTLITIGESISGPGGGLVSVATAAFYFYMPFEAYYTAKKRQMAAQGIELETPIDRLHQQFGEMKDKEVWGGVALVVLGALFLADNFNLIRFERIGQLWPVVLIGLGIWLLKGRQGGLK